MFDYEIGPIRPPSEAKSLLIRLTRGCHWNKCFFCGLYKKMTFSVRPVADVLDDIKKAADSYGDKKDTFQSCFLQDGDALYLPTTDLLTIAGAIKQHFPSIKYITSYGRADTIIKKSVGELREIKEAGINHLYCGMETGSDIILKKINKGHTAEDILLSGLLCKEADITLSEFLLLGIGGKELWEENAVRTAAVLNEINPEFIRVHATAFKDGTKLGRDLQNGAFTLQSEEEIVIEQKMLIEGLGGIESYYVNEHGVNLLLEVRGKMPEAKENMLKIIEAYLNLPDDVKLHYALGRRMGYYLLLSDVQDARKKSMVDEKIDYIKRQRPDVDFNKLCNQFRAEMI